MYFFDHIIFIRQEEPKLPAISCHPSFLPVLPVCVFIKVTSNRYSGRNCIQDTEDSDPYHQSFQFLNFRASFTFHNGSKWEKKIKMSISIT